MGCGEEGGSPISSPIWAMGEAPRMWPLQSCPRALKGRIACFAHCFVTETAFLRARHLVTSGPSYPGGSYCRHLHVWEISQPYRLTGKIEFPAAWAARKDHRILIRDTAKAKFTWLCPPKQPICRNELESPCAWFSPLACTRGPAAV